MLIATLGGVSGGHFNPAITFAAALLRRIDPIDAVVYILAQLSGGVLGALLVKGILLDEGRAGHYGAASVSPLLGGNFQGMLVEGIGTFLLVLAVCGVAFNPRARREWAPLVIGLTLGFAVMILGPLTGASLNPARWFGPALIGNSFGGTWPYLVGPLLGSTLAALFYRFVIVGPQFGLGPEPPTGDARAVANVAADVETAIRPKN
jgi:MIP family channel proteins